MVAQVFYWGENTEFIGGGKTYVPVDSSSSQMVRVLLAL